jgi:hypothetical protein
MATIERGHRFAVALANSSMQIRIGSTIGGL